MFFQLDDYTLTAAQILELLDKNLLNRDLPCLPHASVEQFRHAYR